MTDRIINLLMRIIIVFAPYRISLWFKGKKMALRSYWLHPQFKTCPSTVRFGVIGQLNGLDNISIGTHTSFGDWLYLTAWKKYNNNVSVTIGNQCSFGAFNHITCTNEVTIEDNCLTGKWVTISDNNHGNTDSVSLSISPNDRDVISKGPVRIGKNVWIGDKATILSGVTIGEGAVIAANSVVVKDVPAFCVAAGNPAEIIKQN